MGIDREKVIKGLEQCNQYGSNCKVCPYYDPEDDGGCHAEELMYDAIKLIDTQYKLILELQNLISIGTKMMNGGEVNEID